jgi:hypothetical protein
MPAERQLSKIPIWVDLRAIMTLIARRGDIRLAFCGRAQSGQGRASHQVRPILSRSGLPRARIGEVGRLKGFHDWSEPIPFRVAGNVARA